MRKATVIKRLCREILGVNIYVNKYREWMTDCHEIIYYSTVTDTEGDIAFRENFISRCPIAANYSDALISALHEIGHIITDEQRYCIEAEYETYEEYFASHDEMLATEWAISWLNDKANKSLADCFEKDWLSAV